MDPNPYESPKAESESPSQGQVEQLLLSPLRIPLAIACGLIVLIFAAMVVGWGVYAFTSGISDPRDRGVISFVIPLALTEALAFGLMAWGLIARQGAPLGWGLVLFVLGIFLPITILLVIGPGR